MMNVGEIRKRFDAAVSSWQFGFFIVAGQWTIGPFGPDGLPVETEDVTDKRKRTTRCETVDQVVDVVRRDTL